MPAKILGATGWSGAILVLASVVHQVLEPEQQEISWWFAVAGLALVVLYTLGQWREIVGLFSRHQARYGALAMSSVLIAVGILVAINYITNRQNKRWDLTAARQYSLSDQTLRILELLESPIAIRVLAREEEFPRFRNRLDEYAYASSYVSVEYIDVDRNPVVARQYDIQSYGYGTVVFDYEGRIERVVSTDEQELTNALIKAVEGNEQTVYFVQGHGEHSPENTEQDGYSTLTEGLRRDNLKVESVVLAQTGAVPADAAVLVIAGPDIDFLPAEVELLRGYLEGGGKALFLLDPPETTEALDVPNLIELIAEWGIEVSRNFVVDFSGVGQLLGTGPTVPIAAPPYPPHPITNRFNLLTGYPLARSVTPTTSAPADRVAESFIVTSPNSWAESNLAELATGEVALNEDQGDVTGPVSIAAAVSVEVEVPDSPATSETNAVINDETAESAGGKETESVQARVAVIGDSDFVSNGAGIGIQGNADLALNTVNWLAQQENLIAIRPRAAEDRRITLTAGQQQRITWLLLAVVPGVILGTGIYTWWRRR